MGLAFADQISDRGHVDQNLKHRNSSAAIRTRQQRLRRHPPQTFGQHHANLRLLRLSAADDGPSPSCGRRCEVASPSMLHKVTSSQNHSTSTYVICAVFSLRRLGTLIV